MQSSAAQNHACRSLFVGPGLSTHVYTGRTRVPAGLQLSLTWGTADMSLQQLLMGPIHSKGLVDNTGAEHCSAIRPLSDRGWSNWGFRRKHAGPLKEVCRQLAWSRRTLRPPNGWIYQLRQNWGQRPPEPRTRPEGVRQTAHVGRPSPEPEALPLLPHVLTGCESEVSLCC